MKTINVTAQTLSLDELRAFITGKWPGVWEMTDEAGSVGLKALPAARVAITLETFLRFGRELAIRFGYQAAYGPWMGDQSDWRRYWYCRECGRRGLKILDIQHIDLCKVDAFTDQPESWS